MSTENVKLKVMVVDDTTALREILATLLTNEGYDVVGKCATGAVVMASIEQWQPDIVCLDYHLPDIDGMTLLKSIHQACPTVSVVMITGDTNPELEATAAEAGAAGFIRKPFSKDRITGEMRQISQLQHLLKQQASNRSVPNKRGRARAVIADDSATMRCLLASILTQADVEVVGQASNGAQAAELVAKYNPDLTCLDIEMPVMSGLDALKDVRLQCSSTKVLMITSRAERELVAQAVENGASGYILKPFAPARIMAMVDKLLSQ